MKLIRTIIFPDPTKPPIVDLDYDPGYADGGYADRVWSAFSRGIFVKAMFELADGVKITYETQKPE